MNHILPRLILLPVAAALVAVSCNKNVGEGANVALKRQFDAWRAIHYPAAQEKDGIYIIEDIPGTGREWDDDLPVTFLTYTMRDLDGTVTYNTDEQWAKQMGTWTRTGYYGPQITLTGEEASYAGLDVLLDGMRQGGTRTAIIPSWMLTYKRYDSTEKYLEVSTDAVSTIYTVTFLDQTANLKDYEFRNLKDYAAETPYLFCPGNHDSRGRANRHLEKVWMYRQPEERDVRDWDLGRNFAVRLGEMALVGLDTAEDKLDTNPRFAGLFKSAEYREAQTAWLRDALKRPEIASAPYLVAFCHIPLFDDDPSHNPGDVAPDDTDPRYTTDYAYWQRTCGNMWGPLLHEAGCQVLIVGHLHRYRYYAPGADRCWAQLVGGGRDMKEGPGFPTVIEGKVMGDRLRLTVHNIFAGTVQDVFEFLPR